MRNTAVLLQVSSALMLSLTLCGCTTIYDCKYECDQKIRAHQAWSAFDGCHDQCFTGDYRTGWKAGYYDVVTGGNGCPPVVPPKRYWRPPVCFEHEPCRRNEWYCGWQDGAACAKCEPDFHHLQAWMQCGPNCCPVSHSVSSHVPADIIMEAPPTDAQLPSNSELPIEPEMPLDPMTMPPGENATDVLPMPEGYDKDPMPLIGTQPSEPPASEANPVEPAPAESEKPNAQRRLPADFISVRRLVENARRQDEEARQQPKAEVPKQVRASQRPAGDSMLRALVSNANPGTR